MKKTGVISIVIVLLLSVSALGSEDIKDTLLTDPDPNFDTDEYTDKMSTNISDNIIQLNWDNWGGTTPKISDNGCVVWASRIHNTSDPFEIFYWNGTTTARLTNNSYWDYWPEINANGVAVWHGNNGNNREIYVYDGTSVTQLTNNSYSDNNPEINDLGQIVWRGDDGFDNEIFLWDGFTITQITDNDYADGRPVFNNLGQIVWTATPDGLDSEIFFWDGSNVTQLTNNSDYEGGYPDINNNGEVVWGSYDGSDSSTSEVFLWNGSETIQITNNSYYDNDHPYINDNGELTWYGVINDECEIFHWNGSGIIQITESGDNSGYAPHINNKGHITWANMSWSGDVSYIEVCFWDGNNIINITNNTRWDDLPVINNKDQLAWMSKDTSGATATNICYIDLNGLIESDTGPVHNIDTDEYFNEIQIAIDDPETLDGHTVEVLSGTYFENIVINKKITLIGEDKYTTIIDANGTGDVVLCTVNWVNISGFTITNSGLNPDDAGIELRGVQNCSIEDNIFSNNEIGISLSGSNGNLTQLTDNDYGDWGPQINNNGFVVWEGKYNNDPSEIFFWDGFNTTRLTYNSYWDQQPQINSNGTIVWRGGGITDDSEIFIWDGINVTQLTNNSYVDTNPEINDNGCIVWQARPDGLDDEIFIWDGSNVTQITNNNYSDVWPQINNLGQVVWEAWYPSADNEIFFWDGTIITQLTNNSDSERNPKINNNGQVVWDSYDGNDPNTWEIFFWNGTEIIQLTNNSYYDVAPDINDRGHVVWMGFDGNDYEIFFWDGTIVTQLTFNGHRGAPEINNNDHVIWSNISFDYGEIFFWDGFEIIRITNNIYMDSYYQINNNGQIAWVTRASGPIDTWEIFFCDIFGTSINTSNNLIYHNSFINNNIQANDNGSNSLDNGYPSGGNYWDDYSGIDIFSGPDQNQSGSDGIGDTPYIIDADSRDNYPFMNPWNTPMIIATATGPQGAGHDPIITITYDWTGLPTSVDLYYSNDTGNSWNQLGTDTSVDGFYDWGPASNPAPKPSKYWWIANAQNGSDDVGIPANGTPPEAGPYNWKTHDLKINDGQPILNPSDNWELVSVPLDVSGDPGYVFDDDNWGDGGTKWDVIQWYDQLDPADPWKSYSIHRPPGANDAVIVDNTRGFWIHIINNDGDGALTVGEGSMPISTSIDLYAGWNMVSYPTETEMIVADALSGTGADKVEVFDPAEPYRIREVGPTYLMKPGEGYWVHVPVDSVWVVDW